MCEGRERPAPLAVSNLPEVATQWYSTFPRRCLLAKLKNQALGSELENILAQALKLDVDARTTLAQILLESLDEPADAESERLWLSEAERRQREVREGRVHLVPGDEVRA